MVKLPVEDFDYHLQSLKDWLFRYRPSQDFLIRPVRLLELEEFSELAANSMQINIVATSSETHEKYRQTAMNCIRQWFNMEFKLRCNLCGTSHYQDEVSAPER